MLEILMLNKTIYPIRLTIKACIDLVKKDYIEVPDDYFS